MLQEELLSKRNLGNFIFKKVDRTNPIIVRHYLGEKVINPAPGHYRVAHN
jgi:hypothetical protein